MTSENDRRESIDPGQTVFHYDREERLAGRPDPSDQPRGFFRRNRGLTIVMLDVLLVLFMFMIYMMFLRGDPGSATVGAYRVESSAFRFGDEIYTTVTVTVREGESDAVPEVSGSQALFEVTMPDDASVTDVLPTDSAFPTVVRHVSPATVVSAEGRVTILIHHDGQDVELSPRVEE